MDEPSLFVAEPQTGSTISPSVSFHALSLIFPQEGPVSLSRSFSKPPRKTTSASSAIPSISGVLLWNHFHHDVSTLPACFSD